MWPLRFHFCWSIMACEKYAITTSVIHVPVCSLPTAFQWSRFRNGLVTVTFLPQQTSMLTLITVQNCRQQRPWYRDFIWAARITRNRQKMRQFRRELRLIRRELRQKPDWPRKIKTPKSPQKRRKARQKPCFSKENWRRGRDSNPRGIAPKLISSQPRYDRFDTSPYLSSTSALKIRLGKRRELMERTANIYLFRIPQNPSKIKVFQLLASR